MKLDDIEITLLGIPGCPHWQTARDRLDEALRSIGTHIEVTVHRVGSDEEARRTGFRGSPTILIDRRDPFAAEHGSDALTRRLYRSPTEVQGAPSVDQLITEMNRQGRNWIIGLGVFAVAACCALPALLAITAGVAIAGLALRWWLVSAFGVAATAGVLWYRRRVVCEGKERE